MELIKKLFSFNDDTASAIGLCKFNNEFMDLADAKVRLKNKIKKDVTLSQMLRKKAY